MYTSLSIWPIKICTTAEKGRGVFATRDISTGEVIEECEVILLSKWDINFIKNTTLDRYYFWWGG
jgi:SET domain-containing protein